MAAPEAPTRKPRKSVVGVVVSDKMDKTITIAVERRVLHPRYRKYVRATTTYKAHDERDEAHEGDKVRIVESRPYSKSKHWRLIEILVHAESTVAVNLDAPDTTPDEVPAPAPEAEAPAAEPEGGE